MQKLLQKTEKSEEVQLGFQTAAERIQEVNQLAQQ